MLSAMGGGFCAHDDVLLGQTQEEGFAWSDLGGAEGKPWLRGRLPVVDMVVEQMDCGEPILCRDSGGSTSKPLIPM